MFASQTLVCSSSAFQQLDMLFALAQDVGRLGNKRRMSASRAAGRVGADGNKEVRIFGRASASLDPRIRGPERVRRMKGEGFNPVLQQQVPRAAKAAFNSRVKLVSLEFVFMEGVGAGLRARFGVVAFVRRGDNEQAIAAQHACSFADEKPIIAKMFDNFECHNQIETRRREREAFAGPRGKMRHSLSG